MANDLETAIRQAYENEFCRLRTFPTHVRLHPDDAQALAWNFAATTEMVDGRHAATAFMVLAMGVVQIEQDPTMIPGCVDVYTPTAEPWLAGSRDQEADTADPILCEECGSRLAESHGVDGWLCSSCDEDLHPRYEG